MLRSFFRLVLYIALFLATAGVAAVITNHLLITSHDTVVVPDMVGRDLVSAMRVLTGLGLDAKLIGTEHSRIVAKNQVLLQEPTPGKSVKKGRSVLLTLSAGPRSLLMPDLSGSALRAAKVTLEESGLPEPRVSWIYAADSSPETVLAQVPAPEAKTSVDEQPSLLVSLGPKPRSLKMPNLAGLSPEDAVLALERAGLGTGPVRSRRDTALPEGVIVEQKPAAGFRVFPGALAELFVNLPSGDESPLTAPVNFVRVSLPPGFLKSRIRLQARGWEPLSTLFSDYIRPGTTLWLLLPKKTKGFRLEKDGKPLRDEPYKARFSVDGPTARLIGY